MDLLQQYAQILDFQYEVYLVPDGLFGSPDEFGNWNGVIGEIMNGVNPPNSLYVFNILINLICYLLRLI